VRLVGTGKGGFFVNSERGLDLADPLDPDDEVQILQALSGG